MSQSTPTVQELPPAVRERIGFLLAKNHLAVLGMLAERVKLGGGAGLAGKAFGCLSVVADEGPLSQHELGRRLGVDRSTIVTVVDQLEADRLVERERNPTDRRAYALRVTRRGRVWLEQASKAVLEIEREFLEPLSAAERRQLIGMLQRLLVRG
jgi:DNA-binding MarR family transcriptional regulator